jgi:hypothetical protein
MIEAVAGNTFYWTIPVGVTGLTGSVGAAILKGDGTTQVARSTAGIVESASGSGMYIATLTAPAAGRYILEGDDGSGTYFPEELVVTAATDGAPASAVLVSFFAGGTLTLVIGDDYNASDGLALDFTDTNNTWPDLTGATVSFKVARTEGGTAYLTVTGSVVVATGTGKKVRAAPTATNTATLQRGENFYAVIVTLASSRKVTVAKGPLRAVPAP